MGSSPHQHLQHLSAAPGSRSPPREGAGPRGHLPGRAASGDLSRQLRAGGKNSRKKGSNQTEIPCTVHCLRFLPRSAGRAAPLLPPAPCLVKRRGDNETCCFFGCCAKRPSALLQAGGGDGCPGSSSAAGRVWSPEPATSPSPSASPR